MTFFRQEAEGMVKIFTRFAKILMEKYREKEANTRKDDFFQYTVDGDSKRPVSVEKGKSARLYFEFQEMQDGVVQFEG